jgi:hypothetical protein
MLRCPPSSGRKVKEIELYWAARHPLREEARMEDRYAGKLTIEIRYCIV